jgi:cysteine desulfurase
VHRGSRSYIGTRLQLAIDRRLRIPTPARLYLDHAATTPVLPEARAAMAEALDRWANPGSPHADGRAARAELEQARERIKRLLGWSGELIFTSGATEAARLAFRRCHLQGPKPAMSMVEHDAVRSQAGPEDRWNLNVGSTGLLNPRDLGFWLNTAPGGVIAVQHVNNETGVIQPLGDIVEVVDAAGSYLLADCAQSAGKVALPPADLIMVSAHKLGGPPGVGALLARDLNLLVPEGAQERGYRRGTENLPAIMGFAAALEANAWDMAHIETMRKYLESRLVEHGAIIVGERQAPVEPAPRLPTIGAYAMPHVSAMAQLVQFDSRGISVSAGSACSSGTTKGSHVTDAMGIAPDVASRMIRVSFGPSTQMNDVMTFADAWIAIADEAKARAA